ncbi:MAG TPA: YceI family protein [Steroidobacteraceae bacterium]|nr:YceI family protein [Steroidobacteraceae bacterium]
MQKIYAVAAVVALACTFAGATVARAAEEAYTIDTNHTHATFAFQHLGFSTFHGKVPAKGGTVVIDREARTGRVAVEFDPNAVATGVPKFDEHLRSADFFEVAKHPTASFKSSRITFDEKGAPKTVIGDLTIKGITKPVTLQVTSFHCGDHPMAKVPACGANATASIKRSDYDMSFALPAVPDEIGLEIEIEAMKKK